MATQNASLKSGNRRFHFEVTDLFKFKIVYRKENIGKKFFL